MRGELRLLALTYLQCFLALTERTRSEKRSAVRQETEREMVIRLTLGIFSPDVNKVRRMARTR